MVRSRILCVLVLIIGLNSLVSASDWSRFRGPNGSGISSDTASTPVEWSPDRNVRWKTPLPGAGVSSPIVVGDLLFVTCYSGYGANFGKIEDLKRHLVCVDRSSGKILWDKSVDAVLPEDSYSGMGIPSHGYASHTPVSDGKHIYVFFGKSGVLAYDLEGKQRWHQSVGTESDRRRWGSASSPILHEDNVIVVASAESEAIIALNAETGDEVWRQEAAGLANVWGTPLIVKIDDERTDLVLGVPYEIWGFNPDSGKLRWYSEISAGDQYSSSLVAVQDVVYSIEGRGGGSAAVRAGGKGDVTKSHTVWSGSDSSRFGTPVVYQGRLYFFASGVATCNDAKTGKKVFQGRLEGGSSSGGGGRSRFGRGGGGSDYSSPVVADGKIYYVQSSGSCFVLKAGDKFEQLAVNSVTTDRESFGATPALSNGEIFLRSDKHLYCVSETAQK
ncbi:MAG: PQQ-binding-like beta-propeller repeat protein [Planctomycetaceae bacterium]|nr:PQQ-binding-like beta-propeller repeat protein [Planctomycetaceae bacterium]